MPTVHHVRLRHAGAPHQRGSEQSPVLITLVVIGTIGVLAYAAFLLNPANRGDFLPYIMVVSAELVLVGHALLTMATILAGGQDPRTFAVHQARAHLYQHTTGGDATTWPVTLDGQPVTVDVLITVYGEPVEVVERTVRAAMAIRGRHRTWILDDGDSDDMRDMAARVGCRYVRRLGSHGAKAGNVNHALTLAKGEYFVIFDADFIPKPEFIEQTLPFFIDDRLAFVQTPQSYGNEGQSVIAKGAAYMQTVFYKFVQPGKNRFNAAFCVGTNVMFRREAVLEVGGIYTDSKSEDVWTSLMMHERGWRSIFIPEVLAVGDAPENVEAFSKQQLRWATGGFEILFTHPLWSWKKSKLTLDQRIQYLSTASFYLTGIVPGILLLVPPLEIFFDLRPVSLSISALEWAIYYAGFYLMQVILVWFTLGTYRWETLTLATVSFPIYSKALFNVLRGKEVGWQATGTLKQSSPFNFMIPQLLMLVFLAIASVVAIFRDWTNGFLTLATVWNVTNTIILSAFVYAAATEGKPRGRSRLPWRRDDADDGSGAAAADDLDAELDALLSAEAEREASREATASPGTTAVLTAPAALRANALREQAVVAQAPAALAPAIGAPSAQAPAPAPRTRSSRGSSATASATDRGKARPAATPAKKKASPKAAAPQTKAKAATTKADAKPAKKATSTKAAAPKTKAKAPTTKTDAKPAKKTAATKTKAKAAAKTTATKAKPKAEAKPAKKAANTKAAAPKAKTKTTTASSSTKKTSTKGKGKK